MTDKEILEVEKDKFKDYFNSVLQDFSEYLDELSSEDYKESEVKNEIELKKVRLVKYIDKNFPSQEPKIINGVVVQHPNNVVNFNLNQTFSQMCSEFENLHNDYVENL
ncbi:MULTISPECIES: hypothetical protein [Bizionia]|uniref:Uncharacterized protein n=1 Tax=Bizionia algoritergicola TaxID=291187 RepID=A0A5D0QNR3_9FLAO|nr:MULTISPECIES: hypothetical protein [Bizionia]OBX18056.1 hypothetical protein BAA08_15590 [Bizionia sp. APA-3]TYB70008.1 hypothetical protein ES675_15985 [Bizionia algoritergicola]